MAQADASNKGFDWVSDRHESSKSTIKIDVENE